MSNKLPEGESVLTRLHDYNGEVFEVQMKTKQLCGTSRR